MRRPRLVAAALLAPLTLMLAPQSIDGRQGVRVERLPENPLITIKSSPTLGGNVNGPTVIRVPEWLDHPLGRYYMYFANHMGEFIRLAYADKPAGPWKVYEPGVLHVRDTAFYRPLPDPPGALADFYTHVASPEIYVDSANRRIVMWFHGWWTNGERWPGTLAEARAWARQKQYGQFTQSAESSDGLRFTIRAPITKQSYLRVFPYRGVFYGMTRLGQLARSTDPLARFELGPNPFRDTAYANRVRHVALAAHQDRLQVYFTAIGDAPEHVLMTTIALGGDWQSWRAEAPVAVVRPEAPYECANLPDAPSEPGDIETPVKQLRDPFVFEDGGRTLLFYSTCGEQGIAAAVINPMQ